MTSKIELECACLFDCGPFLLPEPPPKVYFEKSIKHCHIAMKFGEVNKSKILNRFVLHTLQRNFTHLAVITRKTKKKLVILKEGGNWKRAKKCLSYSFHI